ncbi:MAG: hypothetical protein MNPFHGCM_03214 [Gemmatimonadaceae bacterium]|nr:hypothetical protein [Gemmatimonadaceae bacterium]
MSTYRVAIAALGLVATSAGAQDTKDQLQKCDKPIGTLAVVEPQNEYLIALQRYQLGSPTGLIRMMVQQSKCFLVVERGQAMNNIKQERELAKAGELQQDENMGGGQMKAADFILTPAVVISNPNAGGVGGAVGGLLGRRSGLAAIAGGLKFKEAQTSMLIADARTTIQVAAAEGKAKKTDFALGALGWAGGAVGAVGGYTNTAEGKVIAASYLDNFNNIVTAIKADPELMGRADKFKATGLSGADTKAGATFAEGTVLAPKIDNVKLLAEANDAAKVVSMLKKTDEVVFLGEESDGFLKVQGSSGEGWVKKTLMAKK